MPETSESPQASEFPQQWNLDIFFPHPEEEEFQSKLQHLHDHYMGLAAASEQLPKIKVEESISEHWAEFLKIYSDLNILSQSMNSFVSCHAAADAENKTIQKMEAQLATLDPIGTQISTNIELAIAKTSNKTLSQFIESNPALQEVAYYLESCKKDAAFRLPKEQEILAAELSVDGIHAWGRLYDQLSGSLKIEVFEKGEIIQKSPGQVSFDSPERSIRENNFYSSKKAWESIGETCASALNHIAGTRLTRYRHLGLKDHLDSPLRFNKMKRETLNTMWETITSRKEMLKTFLEKKAGLLGLDKMSWYDLTAPLPLDSQSNHIPYDDACQQIIQTFQSFSTDMGEFAENALTNHWIEAENRSGKRQGGFCTGLPIRQESRIFMTYTDTADSMSTLAHELGHAYHSHVLNDQPFLHQDYPMNLAETASTFAECVLGEDRLKFSESDSDKKMILEQMLTDSATYLMNIHSRFLFEDQFHLERAKGELSAERLSELMVKAQKEAYLDVLDENGWNETFWISKLHFYISSWPFYNFPYTFGYLLSLGLYALAEEMGEEFESRFSQFLIATGSMDTEEAVKSTFDYDLSEPEFWNKSLDIIQSRVDLFMELCEK